MIRTLCIGILASCSYISMTYSMEYAAIANDPMQTNEKPISVNPPTGPITWEDDPTNANLWRVNLPKFIQHLCKDRELTPEQSQFLEELQTVPFPCVMNEEDISMLESFGCMHLFKVEETNDGWYIQHGSLQQKIKPGHTLHKTTREQLRKQTP